MASLPIGGLYHHFKDILQDLWLLWELILLAEPLVVMAPDPGVCSEAVVSLVNLINPVRMMTASERGINMNIRHSLYFFLDSLLWRLSTLFHHSRSRLQIICYQE